MPSNAQAVGRVVQLRGFTGTTQQPVIGVAEDVRMASRDCVMPTVYQPLGAAALAHGYILVRSSLSPAQTERLVADALARTGEGVRLVAGQSLRLVAVGALLGTMGGYALSRALGSRIFGVGTIDPATYTAAIVTLGAVAALASALPARTAMRIDPMETLRLE